MALFFKVLKTVNLCRSLKAAVVRKLRNWQKARAQLAYSAGQLKGKPQCKASKRNARCACKPQCFTTLSSSKLNNSREKGDSSVNFAKLRVLKDWREIGVQAEAKER